MRVVVFLPFYAAAVYAFARQRAWIQPWCLLWAGATIGMHIPIIADNLAGSVAAQPFMYLSIHGVPIAVRFACKSPRSRAQAALTLIVRMSDAAFETAVPAQTDWFMHR